MQAEELQWLELGVVMKVACLEHSLQVQVEMPKAEAYLLQDCVEQEGEEEDRGIP